MATILIVDDQILSRKFLTMLLGYSGHRLLQAADGREALQIAHAERPDLIITDILMPNMDGYEFAAHVRADTSIAGTPILFYTAAYREREAETLARACGVQRVLAKPSESEAILQAVSAMLGLSRQAIASPPTADNAGGRGPTSLDGRVANYLDELDASSAEMLRLVESGRQPAKEEERRQLERTAQRLTHALTNLQMVGLRLTALIELGMTLGTERDPLRILETGVRVAQDLAVSKYAVAAVVCESGVRLCHVGPRGLDAATRDALGASVCGTGILERLLLNGRPLRAAGLGGAPCRIGLPASHPPISSFLGTPIAAGGRCHGWLYLADKLGTEGFSEVDELAVATVATQMAIVYDNLTLYENVRRGQESLRHALRARTVMAKCNQVMVHATDEATLLADMCRIIVEVGSYHMVWIGYAQEDGSVRPMAHAGAEHGFLHEAAIRWQKGADDWTAAGDAIRKKQPCLITDCAASADNGPWRESAFQRGYRAVAALPLKDGDQAFGALTLFERAPGGIDADDIALFTELADDIAYGVLNLRTREERRKAEQSLRVAEEKLSGILGSIDNIVWSAANGVLLYVNPVVEKIYGRTIEEFQRNRRLWLKVIHPVDRPGVRERLARLREQGAAHQEFRILRPDGQVRWIEHRSRLVRDADGAPLRIDAVESDITERKEYEARIEYLADHDALTGLANRNLLDDRMTQAIALARRNKSMLALLFLDLDRFKAVNDSGGHALGDLLLKAVAARLEATVRGGDTVARQGGDEFIILLTGINTPDDIIGAVTKICNRFAAPFVLDGHLFHVTASIGVTVFPNDGTTLHELLRNADTAMYHAKAAHGDTYRFYAQDMSVRAMERVQIENALHRAVEQGAFDLHYQPKPDLRSGRIIGAEALIRWHDPELGMISPTRFIPIAEEAGLIVPIGRWVLATVCAQNKAWQDMGLPPISIAVNLSARQFHQEDLVDTVAGVLDHAGLDARFLELELTESMVMNGAEHFIVKLRALKTLGVQLSIDDFGTGYSSLSYLKRFSLDRLKIDQSFIRDIGTDSDDDAITRSVIALGHGLNLKVIAEGVETVQQLEFLRRHQCDEMQGYYFSKALAADDFASLLRRGACLYH